MSVYVCVSVCVCLCECVHSCVQNVCTFYSKSQYEEKVSTFVITLQRVKKN